MSSENAPAARARREPPRFRHVRVQRVEHLSAHMVRVKWEGPDLDGLTVELPAASVRLLLPAPGANDVVVPSWNGNEFLLPDGRRPTIRTLTPRHVDAAALELDVDIVVHDGGALSGWVQTTEPGRTAAISGPGRGYTIDREAPAFLLAGDETAIPAISQLIETLPKGTPVNVHIEVGHPDGRLVLPHHPSAKVEWHDLSSGSTSGAALVAAVRGASIVPGARVWAAGEAAAMQQIRRHLFEERGLARGQATVRGYWKRGASGDAEDD
jgi:NADPH-dependent ferric siderophore reductase